MRNRFLLPKLRGSELSLILINKAELGLCKVFVFLFLE